MTPDIPRSEPETKRALALGLRYRPDLVLQSGDTIYDALYADEATVDEQWLAHRRIYRTSARRSRTRSATTTAGPTTGDSHPDGGKVRALRELGLKKGYYALRLGAWKLIVLDSITLLGEGLYTGRLGDEQTAWLQRELESTPRSTHVVIASHIPIQTALPFTDASLRQADDSFLVPAGWGVHSDLPELNDLFLRHLNVQLALSGHNHVRDDITYNTVRFANGGAVSGNWWDEADPGYRDTPAGFAIVDLFRDGSAEIRFLSYREVGELEVSADGRRARWGAAIRRRR